MLIITDPRNAIYRIVLCRNSPFVGILACRNGIFLSQDLSLTILCCVCITYNTTERIQLHNSQQPAPTFFLGHNAYSDMTEQEFAQYFKLGEHSHMGVVPPVPEVSVAEQRRALFEEVEPLQLPDYVN